MPMTTEQYTDPEPIGDPRQRVRAQRVGQSGVDQISYAQWQQQQGNAPSAVQGNGQPNGTQYMQPGVQYGPQSSTQPGVQSYAPQPAPQMVPVQGAPMSAPPMAHAASPAPLAEGFVKQVNEKYDGDISKALFNSETRAWARALGVMDSDTLFSADLSEDRIDTIKRVFKDPSLDAVSKLDAVRILLRSSLPERSTAHAGHMR